MHRTLLIAYAPRPQGEDALRLGRSLSDVLEMDRAVVEVIDWPDGLVLDGDLEIVTRERREELAEHVVAEFGSAPADIIVRSGGSAGRVIQAEAAALAARLLVIGSAHHGPIGDAVLGATGETVILDAPCAVAIAPRRYTESSDHEIRRIGVGFDGSAEAWTALETAVGVAGLVGGTVSVIVVARFPSWSHATAYATLTLAEYHERDLEEREEMMRSGLERVPAPIRGEGVVITGPPGEVLAEHSRDLDLMLVGSRGYGRLKRTILGSTSRKLLRNAHCPVLITPRGAGLDPLELRTAAASVRS
ncbi:universal stress protein [Thermoleophilia bacterium SCSIO 60948]|nr:universal stress protein [Thermoleophilia bacterium SCSIO 60948]